MKKIQAEETMSSDLITIGWNERMTIAYRRMQTQKVRHLPVVDEEGEVVGMLSDRDVQRAMISRVEHSLNRQFSEETIEFDPEAQVRDYMTWPVRTVDHKADLASVTEQMIREKVSSLLVQSRIGTTPKIVGIITAEDLLKVLATLLARPDPSYQWTLDQVMDGMFWTRGPIA